MPVPVLVPLLVLPVFDWLPVAPDWVPDCLPDWLPLVPWLPPWIVLLVLVLGLFVLVSMLPETEASPTGVLTLPDPDVPLSFIVPEVPLSQLPDRVPRVWLVVLLLLPRCSAQPAISSAMAQRAIM